MEFGRKGLEVCVLGKTMFGFIERALGLGLKDDLGWTH